jgi:hypothetical protein
VRQILLETEARARDNYRRKSNQRKSDGVFERHRRLDRLEVVKNNKVLHVEEAGTFWASFEMDDGADGKEDYCYLRVRRRDGELGWSSPIWVVR